MTKRLNLFAAEQRQGEVGQPHTEGEVSSFAAWVDKAVLVKDTSYKRLWKVSFTLKEF